MTTIVKKPIIFFWGLVVCLFCACGKKGDDSGTFFTYKLDRSETALFENALLLEFPDGDGYQIKILGEGFSADVNFDEFFPTRHRVGLAYKGYDKYALHLFVNQKDGTPILQDTLTWIADRVVPPEPVVSFSEAGTSDTSLALLIATNRGPSTNELWVQGDLATAFHPEGSWYPIPKTSRIPIQVSSSDGLKTLKVKYRNSYGVESVVSQIQIVKKGTPPTACTATPISMTTFNNSIKFRFSSVDSTESIVRFLGDVDNGEKITRFTGSGIESIPLSPGAGKKVFSVTMHDIAENYCFRKDFTIMVDSAYKPGFVAIKDNPVLVDDNAIIVQGGYEHFADEVLEMFVSGGVVNDERTQKWLPFAAEFPVTLTPTDGTRIVYVQFRIGEFLSPRIGAGTYLKPFIKLAGSAPTYNLAVSNIPNVKGINIEGCSQNYSSIQFFDTLPCTPASAILTATYIFQDGSRTARTVNVP